MPSVLDIPRDVLYNIASLVGVESTSDVLSFMFTCRLIYDSLDRHSDPHALARIFLSKFSISQARRDKEDLDDSRLANELVQRCNLLRRVRTGNLRMDGLVQDLFTAIWVVMEHNEKLLVQTGVTEFLENALFSVASVDEVENGDDVSKHELCAGLVLWLCVMCWSREFISNASDHRRDQLLTILRGFVNPRRVHGVTTAASASALGSSLPVLEYEGSADAHCVDVVHFSRRILVACPDPSSAAIILYFALNELHTLEIPASLPPDRAAAQLANLLGPTQEDFEHMATVRTALFADTRCQGAFPHLPLDLPFTDTDPEFHESLIPGVGSPSVYSELLRGLLGLWEGSYMVAPLQLHDGGDEDSQIPNGEYICRMPFQCALQAYLCYTPRVPLLIEDDNPFSWNIHTVRENARRAAYELLDPTSEDSRHHERDTDQTLDCILIGKTLEEHDEAWGGFFFVGRLYRDGLVVLKRQPKDDNSPMGSWVFSGRLRYGAAFVGTWRSSLVSDEGFHGIFSLSRALPSE